jgi:hypothetical protein
MQQDRAYMESLVKLHSVLVEQITVCHQLCPDMNMERMMEQTVSMKFCVELQELANGTLEMLKTVYGESIMNKSNVFKWHKRFREGREDVNDGERQGAPITK